MKYISIFAKVTTRHELSRIQAIQGASNDRFRGRKVKSDDIAQIYYADIELERSTLKEKKDQKDLYE